MFTKIFPTEIIHIFLFEYITDNVPERVYDKMDFQSSPLRPKIQPDSRILSAMQNGFGLAGSNVSG